MNQIKQTNKAACQLHCIYIIALKLRLAISTEGTCIRVCQSSGPIITMPP